MRSKSPWTNASREPVEMSVALAIANRPGFADEVAERCAAEQDLVVVLRSQFRAPPPVRRQRNPVLRRQEPGEQRALDVALQEPRLVLFEQALAVERVGERGEAAARNAGDDVDLVEQAGGAVADHDVGAPQLLEHAVGERRRARAATRERQHDHRIAGEAADVASLRPIAVGAHRRLQRGIDRPRRAADEEPCSDGKHEPMPGDCRQHGVAGRSAGVRARPRPSGICRGAGSRRLSHQCRDAAVPLHSKGFKGASNRCRLIDCGR